MGGGQSPLYAYLCMPIVRAFGLSVTVMRLPGILMFLAAVYFSPKIFLLKEEGSRAKARTCTCLITIMPVFIMLFRIGMDCDLMLAMAVIFLYLIARAAYSGDIGAYICAGTAGGILLYTYAISYMIMPLFLALFLAYLIYIRKMDWKRMMALGIPLAILAMPLILVQLVNMFDLPEFKLGAFTITKLPMYRSSDVQLSNLSLESVIRTFKSIFMYDHLRYNTLPQFGTIYYVSLPFVAIGIGKGIIIFCSSIKKKIFCFEAVYLLWFLLFAVCGCFMRANTNRLNGVFAAVLFLLVEGIFQVIAWSRTVHCARQAGIVIVCAYLCSFAVFSVYYFGGQYVEDHGSQDFFGYPLDEAITFVEQDERCRGKITYIGNMVETYIYYLGAVQADPYGYAQGETGPYGGYRFGLPERVDCNANYIVEQSELQYCQYLEDAGFQKKELQHYNVYTFSPGQHPDGNGAYAKKVMGIADR